MKIVRSLVVLALLAAVCRVTAQPAAEKPVPQQKPEPTLKVGDKAPPFEAQKWWGGDAQTQTEKGKVYIVDFWATWCGPCLMAMPHLSEIAETYAAKGVRTVAVNVWDTGKPETVETFMQKGANKDYKFIWALDEGDRNGKMSVSWMRAAGRNGIPSTFVIDRDGKIAWIGHPFSAERVVEAVADGTYDAAKEAALDAKLDKLNEEISLAIKAKDWPKMMALNDQKNQLDPHSKFLTDINLFMNLLNQKKDYPAAYQLAHTLVEKTFHKNAAFLNLIGNQIAIVPGDKDRDAALIEQIMARVKELNGGQDERWFKIGNVAIAAAKGDYAKAAELQEAIVKATPIPRMKEIEQKKLDEYKAQIGK